MTLFARIAHRVKWLLAWHQTITTEVFLAGQMALFGLVLLGVSLQIGDYRLLGNVPIGLGGSVFAVHGSVWLRIVSTRNRNVLLCRRGAGFAFILWFYLTCGLSLSAGLSPFALILQVLYLTAMLGSAWCWLRCEVILRGLARAVEP